MKRNAMLGLGLLVAAAVFCQDFGFDDVSEATDATAGVTVGGELGFSVTKTFDNLEDFELSDLDAGALGRLNVDARASKVQAAIHLDVSTTTPASDPRAVLDEAYVGLSLFRGLDLEGGLRKVAWGRADTLGVLDVINPRDLTDLTVTEPLDQKIAQLLLRAVISAGPVSLDLVYLPFFEPDRIAYDGPWAPRRVRELWETAYDALYDALYAQYSAALYASAFAAAYSAAYTAAVELGHPDPAGFAAAQAIGAAEQAVAEGADLLAAQAAEEAEAGLLDLVAQPDTHTFRYGQAGARLEATLGPMDLGAQYFYGYLPTPAMDTDLAAVMAEGKANVTYNRYHQAGLDAAVVLAGFGIRVEGAANITEDVSGDDPLVYNPTIAWSAGVDRDLFAGLSVNLQAKGLVRLMHDRIADAGDLESGAGLTTTQVALVLSQKLLRDTITWRLGGVMSPEDLDFAVDPSVTFSVGDASLVLYGRVFAGSEDGDMGQFADRSYAGVRLQYRF